jgi:hypothetical protein
MLKYFGIKFASQHRYAKVNVRGNFKAAPRAFRDCFEF